MLVRVLTAAALALALAGPAHAACRAPKASTAYKHRIASVLRARTDVLGDKLLAAPGGPTYAGADRFLPPLLFALGPDGKPITASGVYYLAFGMPLGSRGTSDVALHVADGGQILWRRTTGPSLTIWAATNERYGSCLARLEPAQLVQGWLPILETGYRNRAGTHFHEESFAAPGPEGNLASYVHLTANRSARLRVTTHAGTTAVYGRSLTIRWSGYGRAHIVSDEEYRDAKSNLIAFWERKLGNAASISVPEPRVENAMRAILVQELTMTWRYSVGNTYEELSFPEGADDSRVLGEYGYADAAKSILYTSFAHAPGPWASWKEGERLVAASEVVELDDDDAFLAAASPVLARFVNHLDHSMRGNLLRPERYSADVADPVQGLHAQAVVWEGLEAMARVWADDGYSRRAAHARELADRLRAGLRSAVRRSERRLPDGSVFIPAALLGDEKPYVSLTKQRLGSYWNLVLPYALASGLFPPDSREARGAYRYMQLHGSRLLGLVRAGGYALYGRNAPYPTSGTDEVYGSNVARFLGDLDKPDELVLSLYGDLAAAMTPNTFVSGEGATVMPLDGERDRAMYLPPNTASNATFLETLRQLLVHETLAPDGTPVGLQLAPATPRAWLAPGKQISVANLPTSFGPLSYALTAGTDSVDVTVDVPARTPPRTLTLRLRLPGGRTKTIDLSGRTGTVSLEVHFGARESLG
jgi:hypothetical protein